MALINRSDTPHAGFKTKEQRLINNILLIWCQCDDLVCVWVFFLTLSLSKGKRYERGLMLLFLRVGLGGHKPVYTQSGHSEILAVPRRYT